MIKKKVHISILIVKALEKIIKSQANQTSGTLYAIRVLLEEIMTGEFFLRKKSGDVTIIQADM